MSEIGEIIKKLRGKESLREASKKIGISHTYLDTLEKGYDKRSKVPVKPSPDTLRMISSAYDYPYEQLMIAAGYMAEEDIFNLTTTDRDFDKKIKHYGGNISYMLSCRGLPVKKAAEKVGVSHQELFDFYSGKSVIPYEAFEKIAKILDISPERIGAKVLYPELFKDPLELEIEELIKDPETQLFFKDYASAPEDKKAQARNFLKYLLQEEEKNKKNN